jgi:hypothetical protein
MGLSYISNRLTVHNKTGRQTRMPEQNRPSKGGLAFYNIRIKGQMPEIPAKGPAASLSCNSQTLHKFQRISDNVLKEKQIMPDIAGWRFCL